MGLERARVLAVALIGVAATAHADSNPPLPAGDNQLRLELGVGAPGGLMAVRYSRVFEHLRVEPGVGLGTTGPVGSLVLAFPVAKWAKRTPGGTPTAFSVDLYGGASASLFDHDRLHPWSGRAEWLPEGLYVWTDAGLSLQGRLPWFVLTAGIGVTALVQGPDGIGLGDVDESYLWFTSTAGWLEQVGGGPSLWSSIGWEF